MNTSDSATPAAPLHAMTADLLSVSFVDFDRIVAVGSGGRLYHTSGT
jgi:hypothetical protein